MRQFALAVLLVLLLADPAVRAGDSLTQPAPTLPAAEPSSAPAARQQELIEKRARLTFELTDLMKDHDWRHAAIAARERLAVDREINGPVHADVADSLEQFGICIENQGDLDQAKGAYEGELAIREKLPGPENGPQGWRTIDARSNRDETVTVSRLTDSQRQRLQEANQLIPKITRLGQQGDFQGALTAAQQVLEVKAEIMGEQNRDTGRAANTVAVVYEHIGDYPHADEMYRRAFAIDKAALGLEHPDTAAILQNMGSMWLRAGNFLKARGPLRIAFTVRRKTLGLEAFPTFQTAQDLAEADKRAGDYAEAEQLYLLAVQICRKTTGPDSLMVSDCLADLGGLYGKMGENAKAEPPLLKSYEIEMKALGPDRPDVSPKLLDNLAEHYRLTGNFAKAEDLCRRALVVREKYNGMEDPATARSVDNLGFVYMDAGDYAAAEPLFRRSLAIHEKAFGPAHPDTAEIVDDLAELYVKMGDYVKAEALFKRALSIRQESLGPENDETARTMVELAQDYWNMKDYRQGLPLCRQAMTIYEKIFGIDNPRILFCAQTLGGMYSDAGDYARAEPIFRQVMAISEKSKGPESPSMAAGIEDLGEMYVLSGEPSKGEPLLRKAIDLNEKVFGPDSDRVSRGVVMLAACCAAQGRRAESVSLAARAVAAARRQADLTAAVQSERQQLLTAAIARDDLAIYLSLAAGARPEPLAGAVPADDIYNEVLAWKGSVSARQQAMRRLRSAAGHDPETAKLFVELQEDARQLSALTFATSGRFGQPPEHALPQNPQDLSERIERLQADLASRTGNAASMAKRVTVADLQKALPKGTALVDVIQYDRVTVPQPGKPYTLRVPTLAAFVMTADGPANSPAASPPGSRVVWVDLGPTAPVEEAVQRWRPTLGEGPEAEQAGHLLKQLVWDKLKDRVSGAQVVLVSPDGPLCRFPLGALPGEKPGTYLIEEVAVATVPVPRLLPAQLASTDMRQGGGEPPSLLLVGDVDYDADPGGARGLSPGPSPRRSREPNMPGPGGAASAEGVKKRSASRGEDRHRWPRLDGTRAEITAIRDEFARRFPDASADTLEQGLATESALREQMPRHHWLHLATHGFFAGPGERSALSESSPVAIPSAPPSTGPTSRGASEVSIDDAAPLPSIQGAQDVRGFHPGLLSGLVLAGANRPPNAESGGDDGILTALEVEELDLGEVDAAVLSACETGLGQSAGGEGLLGLQRAFQVAGAKTVVASLWQVPDEPTKALMQRFYGNIWDRKLGKVQALREAQIWLMRGGDDPGAAIPPVPETQPDAVERPVPSQSVSGRGLSYRRSGTRPDEAGPRAADQPVQRRPPYIWAAFVLSGDWR